MSQIDFTTCPQCNCNRLYQESSRCLEVVTCRVCGYLDKWIQVSPRHREELKARGYTVTEVTSDGDLIGIMKSSGVGVVRMATKRGANVMSLARPITDEEVASTISVIENGRKYDRKRCYITKWNTETNRVDILYGTICGKGCFLAEGECETCSCNFLIKDS